MSPQSEDGYIMDLAHGPPEKHNLVAVLYLVRKAAICFGQSRKWAQAIYLDTTSKPDCAYFIFVTDMESARELEKDPTDLRKFTAVMQLTMNCSVRYNLWRSDCKPSERQKFQMLYSPGLPREDMLEGLCYQCYKLLEALDVQSLISRDGKLEDGPEEQKRLLKRIKQFVDVEGYAD